jgi:hypothetical protein
LILLAFSVRSSCNTCDLHSIGPWFEPRPRHSTCWLTIFVAFPVLPGKCPYSAATERQQLSSKSLSVHHYSRILAFTLRHQ